MNTVGAKPRRVAAISAWAVLVVAVACAAAELAAGVGYRLAWWGLGTGIQTIRWSAIAATAVGVFALLCTAILFRRRVQRGQAIFLAAAAIGLLAAAPPIYFWYQGQRLPRIHDVSTDTADPPRFVAVVPLRRGARNAVEYDHKVADLQRQGYPDIAPLTLDLPPGRAFERAEAVARSMGWEIVAASGSDLRLEATATTLLFGFKDDVVVRVTPSGTGSKVDVRSLSRIGGSDFGTNAHRIRAFLATLKADASGG